MSISTRSNLERILKTAKLFGLNINSQSQVGYLNKMMYLVI